MRKSSELPNELCAQLGEAETFASAVKRLWRENKLAAASAIVILLFILAAILAPVLTPYTFDSMDLHNRLAPPSRAHLLGTDEAGRDVLTRMLYGSRVSLLVGIVPTVISMLAGAILGIIAGYNGGRTDAVIMRIADVMLAFPNKDELEAYLKEREDALKRDHNKLGRELEYFTTVDCIGQGLPILLPKGARVIQLLQRWVEDTEQERGYLLTKTPLMAKRELYKISGHWDHYLDGMFIMGDPMDETKECFALRPMTCPFQYQVFLNRGRSYRDLPMRLGETSTLFRNEDSGEMHGLIRVRQFTISEGHLVLRPDQLEEEFKQCLDLAKYCLGTVGLLDKCTFRFSQWDPANPNNKYEGTAEQWDHAQSVMERILKDLDVDYTVGIDEAAFYGPKLDIQYKNVYGKEDTLVTIQIDMLLAERFGMYYIDENGNKALPYIIHRTSLGCYERTLAYLIEEYAGALPTWMMPEQVRFLPITDRAADYCVQQAAQLRKQGFRVEVDSRNEKVGKKIREATLEKIPYMLVVGDRDMEAGTVSVRTRTGEDLGAMSLADFSRLLRDVVDSKARK